MGNKVGFMLTEMLDRLLTPGKMKQVDVKILVGEMMTVSALLSGFAIGMSAKITDSQIRAYATFLKAEFFGKHSYAPHPAVSTTKRNYTY